MPSPLSYVSTSPRSRAIFSFTALYHQQAAMPANAEQYTRVRDARRAISQTIIRSRFAANGSQAQCVGQREDRLTWGSLLTTQSPAENGTLFDGATPIDLDECTVDTTRSRRQPPPSTGLPTEFRGLSLTQSSTTLRHDSFNGPRSLKRKAEAEQERDTTPSKGTRTSSSRPQSRRRTGFNQQSDNHNDNTGRGRAGVSSRVPAANITEPCNESEDNGSDDDLQMTSVHRVAKKHKPIVVPRVLITNKESIRVNRIAGQQLQQDTVVEFADGTFMQIQKIYKDQKEGYLLIGHMFVRANTFGPDMPRKRDGLQWTQTRTSNELDTRFPLYYRGGELINEVIQKIRTVVGENKADHGLWRRSIIGVVRTRYLRMTNQSYNDINCTTDSHVSTAHATLATVTRAGLLHCRWKDITVHDQQGKWKEQRLERPSDDECDAAWCDDSEKLRKAWRGATPPITDADSVRFCDGFCGAGGMSEGAKQAGLEVVLAFDKDEKKITTYRNNHPNCKSLVIDANNFIALARKKCWRVDVLHLSFPCQPYSPANVTHNIEKDEQNQAPLLGCTEIIEALQPRVVTVEETDGIRDSRYTPWFHALLQQFTSLGFSIRWSKLTCADYGVPQLRQRLILIAAA